MAKGERPGYTLFSGFTRDLERLIRDHFVDGPSSMAREGIWSPPTDVYEAEGAVVVRMEVPGVRLDEIEVTVVEDRLIIRGRRREEKAACRTCYRQVEIHCGAFLRIIPLNFPFDRGAIGASYRDGFLYVEVPRLAKAPQATLSVRIRVQPEEE